MRMSFNALNGNVLREGNVDNTQNIISFCTGYGGIELGLRRAGVDVRVVCNVEIEAFVQANLVAKIEEGRMDDAPIYTDLKTFPAEIFRGKIHGLIGGYPCQPFSSAGKRKGEEDPRHLWPYIREHVRAIRPVWCFFENVRGHTTMGLWRVLSDLEEDGYRTEWGLFSAEETGAPHQRIRVFILAYSASLGGESKSASEQPECERFTKVADHDSDGQLVNPASEGLEGFGDKARKRSQGREKEERSVTSTDSGAELAHTASREPRQSQARNGGQDIGGGSEEELGNAKHDGLSTAKDGGSTCEEQEEGRMQELEGGCKQSQTQWPARPGEEQYEWEEPRVVVDSKESRLQGCRESHTEDGRECEKDGAEVFCGSTNTGTHERVPGSKEGTSKAQSELGGAVDGLTHRVDRLRLLGNGVVPQTAELAWKTLWRKMNEDND